MSDTTNVTVFAPPSPEATLSAYFKDDTGNLRQLDARVGIDPEGVTEEDVQRLQHSAYIHLDSEQIIFVEPVLVLVRGGKQ